MAGSRAYGLFRSILTSTSRPIVLFRAPTANGTALAMVRLNTEPRIDLRGRQLDESLSGFRACTIKPALLDARLLAANELMARIHPRMPVISHARDYDRWLDRQETERLPIDLLRPFESEEMEMSEANPKVNNVRNNGPEMMRAAIQAAESGELPL